MAVNVGSALTRLAAFAWLASLVLGVCARPTLAGYFPERPRGATMHTMRGVLESYSTGQGIGVIEIRAKGQLELFRPGDAIKMNGQNIDCAPPRSVAAKWLCATWRSSVTFGRSIVVVHYWVDHPSRDKYGSDTPDGTQRVSDQIDLIAS